MFVHFDRHQTKYEHNVSKLATKLFNRVKIHTARTRLIVYVEWGTKTSGNFTYVVHVHVHTYQLPSILPVLTLSEQTKEEFNDRHDVKELVEVDELVVGVVFLQLLQPNAHTHTCSSSTVHAIEYAVGIFMLHVHVLLLANRKPGVTDVP